MNDDEILDAIDRRFAGVETRLPPRRVTSGDGQIRGATVGGAIVRSTSMPLVVVLVLAVAGISVVLFRLPGSSPAAVATASASSPAAVASPLASPATESSPSPQSDLLILRGAASGDAILIEHFGWGPCLVQSEVLIVAPDGAAIDRAIDETGVVDGWAEVPVRFTKVPANMRYWVAPTPESAARGYGARVLAIGGRGSTWIAVGETGHQLVSFKTPKGRTFWILTSSVADSPC